MINDDALGYMATYKFPKNKIAQIASRNPIGFNPAKKWGTFLNEIDITSDLHVRIATEGALLAGVLEHGINP